MIRIPPPRLWDRPAWLLVAANLVPLWGVYALGWSVGPLLWLYWQENLVIGAFAALRIAGARGGEHAGLLKFFLVPFFLVHYGAFCFVHGAFVGLIARSGEPDRFAAMFDLAPAFAAPGTLWILLGFAISHGVSFAAYWRRGGARARATPQEEMARPYGRVIVMHLTVLFGGAAMVFTGAPDFALAGLAALKTAADLAAHFRAHRAPPAAT